ncbi:MAG: STELLO glycosyltransferase family protein [Sphingobacterium thalpophilum]
MNKFIVITSIFEPSEAVIKFSRLNDYKLIVVGDKKTPRHWFCENVTFLSVEQQEVLGYELSKHLPYNHYCRKMLGYLYALSQEADIIIDTDDDNIPRLDWGFPEFTGNYPLIHENLGFVNIYELYTSQKIWPRGYPLRYVNRTKTISQEKISNQEVRVGIWQGLANEDPDVDAIYRLTSDQMCIFEDNGYFVLDKNTISPFNSQNTSFRKELFTLLYLPSFVTFRFTDILRGFIAQPIMWLYGFNLGFTSATVTQKRNPHDYMKDFESEIPMYLYSEKIIELVSASIFGNRSIEDNLYNAYDTLNKADIVCKQEIQVLEAWLIDCKSFVNM